MVSECGRQGSVPPCRELLPHPPCSPVEPPGGLNPQEERLIRTHIAACLLTTALITAPALAQTSSAPTANPPASRAQANTGQFLTQEGPNQWRASKLVGLNV